MTTLYSIQCCNVTHINCNCYDFAVSNGIMDLHLNFFVQLVSSAGFQIEIGSVLVHAPRRSVHRQHASQTPALPSLVHFQNARSQVVVNIEGHHPKERNVMTHRSPSFMHLFISAGSLNSITVEFKLVSPLTFNH